MKYQLDPPTWWVNNKVCYSFWPERKDKGQCTGIKNPTCAGFNEYTAPFRDYTDNSTGSSKITWGLHTPDLDGDWFQDVRICFRYKAERYAGKGQCGIGTAKAFCAKVNHMTPSYLNQTDHRPGGCKMAWKLKVGAQNDNKTPGKLRDIFQISNSNKKLSNKLVEN